VSEDAEGREPGRSAARRRRVEGGRHHRHVVRVTPEEEAQLLALALRYRVSVPKLLVDSALAGGSEVAASNASVRHALITELFGLHRLLANVANNVNQMTKALHATGELPPQTGEVLAAARRTAEKIDDVIDGLSS
jgi:predicted nucleic acid-binding protein